MSDKIVKDKIDKVNPKPWARIVEDGDVSVIDANGEYVVKANDFSAQFFSSDAYYYFIDCVLMHDELQRKADWYDKMHSQPLDVEEYYKEDEEMEPTDDSPKGEIPK